MYRVEKETAYNIIFVKLTSIKKINQKFIKTGLETCTNSIFLFIYYNDLLLL